MEAPKCKICGNRHYGLCPPTSQRGTPLDQPLVRVASKSAGVTAGKTAPTRVDGPKAKTTVSKTVNSGSNPDRSAKFDRLAYQREYMRKRRAAAKK